MSEESSLDSWFLHEKLALKLLSENEAAELASQIPDPSQPFAQSRRIDLLERAIASYLQRGDVESLHVEHLRGRVAPGRLIWLEQAFYFKGLSAALDRIKRREYGAATFYGMLATTDESVRVNGSYNAARITCSTAFGKLSGRQRQFILGYVEDVSGSAIAVRPIVIAQRWLPPSTHIPNFHPSDPCHVWPGDVDQFAEVDFKTRLDMSDLRLLKDLPEALIKEYFADILGEPSVPKDWGGEQFDLWTDRLSIAGKQLRAAIAFKGPAKFAPMTIATLGKNGDQIDRLAQTAADVLVVQHCHQITAPVVNMLKAYASDPRNPRRYMTIDGFNTILILRHFGKL